MFLYEERLLFCKNKTWTWFKANLIFFKSIFSSYMLIYFNTLLFFFYMCIKFLCLAAFGWYTIGNNILKIYCISQFATYKQIWLLNHIPQSWIDLFFLLKSDTNLCSFVFFFSLFQGPSKSHMPSNISRNSLLQLAEDRSRKVVLPRPSHLSSPQRWDQRSPRADSPSSQGSSSSPNPYYKTNPSPHIRAQDVTVNECSVKRQERGLCLSYVLYINTAWITMHIYTGR